MSNNAWYYMKKGFASDDRIGPISPQELLRLGTTGEIDLATSVSNGGDWYTADRIPKLKATIEKRQQDLADEKAQAKAERQVAKQQRKQDAIDAAVERRANSPITRFLIDGQNESVVSKIYDRVNDILTSEEEVEYIAVQTKPTKVAPDCIVLTNRRLIIFRQKLLGQMEFDDFLWLDLSDARIKEGVAFGTISAKAMNGVNISIGYLPKAQARRIYRIAQEREEASIELRRKRSMEESQAGASNIVVNAPAAAPATVAGSPSEDPMEKLTKLKKMLDAGLIKKEEYDEHKSRILESM
ncbi:MAG: PH domain-containing protein [Pirellulaceae bacterium]